MFLNKQEKAMVLLYRMEFIRRDVIDGLILAKTGEKKIEKLRKKIWGLGVNPENQIVIKRDSI
jgi:hypothetical protein